MFVPLALPDEQARVRIVDGKRGYSIAEVEEIVTASEQRVAPACPHFGACGGCQYQHANYAAQLAYKQEILRETLERGGVQRAGRASRCWPQSPGRIAIAFGWRSTPMEMWVTAGGVRTRSFPSPNAPSLRRCWCAPRLQPSRILRESPTKLRVSEISLFCDAAETALLVSVSVADSRKARV